MKRLGVYLVVLLALSSCQHKQPEPIPHDPLATLLEGNRRFMAGQPIHPDQTLERIRQLKKGQHPFAVVVSCSDSRVPPELIFDQGLGDIFSIRTAGNVVGDYELGSIEYAVEHLGCNLVVVLGHKNCGAIDAFLHEEGGRHHDHIQTILDYIASEAEEKSLPDSLKHNLDAAVRANIYHAVHLLQSSEPVLKPRVAHKELRIVGAYYDIETGQVSLLDSSNSIVLK